jgi:DNA-directed RNA polymerase subunit M/transcription elongation factor TFIIS
MKLSERLKTLSCEACGERKIVGPEEMLACLRAAGKLRRDASPDPNLVLELFQQQVANESCKNCGANSLSLANIETDADEWGDPVSCEVCNAIIPPERLEIFPNAKRCAACKDKPAVDEDPEFCPSCGGLLVMRQRGGAGIVRYVMSCTDCGRRP